MTDNHDRFDELVAAYALGAIDPVERPAFEVHLASCERCQKELAELSRVTVGLGLAVDPVAPPDALKARTIAHATAQTRSARSVVAPGTTKHDRPTVGPWKLALAASVLIAVSVGIYAWSLQRQVSDLRTTLADASQRERDLRASLNAARVDSARLLHTLTIVNAPDMLRVSLEGSSAAPGAKGQAYWSRTRGLVVSAEQLPALQPGRIYQLWMVLAGQPPIGAGVFTLAANGATTIEGTLPANFTVPPGAQITVAVTNEPGNGSAAPTMPILLAGSGKAF
jgi:anti-sigma-K factor RskA